MHDGVAPATAQLRPLCFDNLEGTVDELPLFRDITPERTEATATLRAGTFLRREDACLARPGTAAGQADVKYRRRARQGYAAKAA